ncbi:hypothetical protein BBJ28_00012766 [Nothophytophthora sp. Chile5]|nr:hypothetical protein BBJ28_00012766 [Nothophytophthora sp. Chile5]
MHHDDDSSSHGLKIFLIFLATSCIGGGVSALWLQILQNHAARVISWTLRFSIVAFIVASLAAFYDSGMAGKAIGFVNLFFAATILMYYASVRRSIAFAASNLAAASRILRVFPGVVTTAYIALLAQAAWVMVWSVAVIGVLAKAAGNLHDSSSFGNTCFFFMLLSFYWFVQVAKSAVHCVTAGAVGEWWFGAHDVNTIQRSQTRALTTSLGSICFGSLVVAALNALHTLLLSAPRRKATGSANACLEFLVKLVMRNMQYFNKFAFCQVALYGKDFRLAGSDTMRLFRDRGWSALLNDTLISSVLAKLVDLLAETFNVVVLTFAACASIGYAMCTIVSSILDSIVATIFVCFAEVRRFLRCLPVGDVCSRVTLSSGTSGEASPGQGGQSVTNSAVYSQGYTWSETGHPSCKAPLLLSFSHFLLGISLVFSAVCMTHTGPGGFAALSPRRARSARRGLEPSAAGAAHLPLPSRLSSVGDAVGGDHFRNERQPPQRTRRKERTAQRDGSDLPAPPTTLAVQVLRFHTEEKEAATSLKKTRFVYEIETCHQETGDVFRAERRFREFKRLREALLLECRDCLDCHPFTEKLKQSRLPTRQMVVLDAHKYGVSRMLELTHFLRDLVRLVAQHAYDCARDGPDIDKSVALFLGLESLSEAQDVVISSSRTLQMAPAKTRQDRIDFRAASMPDVRFSSSSVRLSDDSLQNHRSRGYSESGGGYAQ